MKYTGIELVRRLSELFGPSGCEDEVREFIETQIEDACDGYYTDRAGNLIAKVSGSGIDYNCNIDDPDSVMICAHMDEVGFMVTDITEEGYLKFGNVGGIDPRVLCGRAVTLKSGKEKSSGVIGTKAIHLQTAEDRKKATPVKNMYIDIGAKDCSDAENYAKVGDVATFDAEFVRFGKDKKMIRAKALDDRMGCAAMIELMRRMADKPFDRSFDLYFAFTTCEEIGISGATVAANAIAPSTAIILECTAVADIEGVEPAKRVGNIGDGVAVSFADRATIYDKQMIDFALTTGEKYGIPCQVKKYVSGGNDAGTVQRSTAGVKTLALSVPTRYIHSASNVANYDDYTSMCDLIESMLRDWRFYK